MDHRGKQEVFLFKGPAEKDGAKMSVRRQLACLSKKTTQECVSGNTGYLVLNTLVPEV